MKRLDLIIDALRIANFEGSNPFPNKATKDIYAQALAAARELRAMEPVAWMDNSVELYVKDRPSETYTIPLYMLD